MYKSGESVVKRFVHSSGTYKNPVSRTLPFSINIKNVSNVEVEMT